MSTGSTQMTPLVSESSLALTWAEIIDRVEVLSGCTSAQALVAVRDGYDRFIKGIAVPDDPAHVWSFLLVDALLTIGEAVTGTATGTTGGVVTATTAIFDKSMVGLTMTISDTATRTCEIIEFVSTTVVNTDDTTGFTSKGISVSSTGIYNAPSDFGGLIEGFTYAYDRGDGLPAIHRTSPKRVMEYWRDTNYTEESLWWALEPQTFVAATGQQRRFLFAPIPDEERVLNYRYRADVAPPTDSSNYPIGGPDMGAAILQCGLAEAEKLYGKLINGTQEQAAQIKMAAAIVIDKQFFNVGTSVESLNDRDRQRKVWR